MRTEPRESSYLNLSIERNPRQHVRLPNCTDGMFILSTPQGKLITNRMASLAEFERSSVGASAERNCGDNCGDEGPGINLRAHSRLHAIGQTHW